MLHLQRPRRGEDLPRLSGDDGDDTTENDDNGDDAAEDDDNGDILSSPGAWRVFKSRTCSTPSSTPHRSPRASTPTRSRRQRQVNIVKIFYLQVTKISQGRTAG